MVVEGIKRRWTGICKRGKLQSPIPLNKRFAYHLNVPPIKLQNFKEFKNVQVENTGETVRLTLPKVCACRRPKISSGFLKQTYTLDHIHFHWPAEHVMDGLRSDLEMHFVFCVDGCNKLENAVSIPYGVTVMAILFFPTNFTRSKNFRTIADAVKLVFDKPGKSTKCCKGINLYHFLPYDHRLFYYYLGSLTVPPCNEYVNWIIFKNSANICCLDLKTLKTIQDKDGELITANHRELQPADERIIYLRSID